jgi:hypothetical protein
LRFQVLEFSTFDAIYETTLKVEVGSILGHFAFVGWVEPMPGFVGFRCTQTNLHFATVIAKCETQQRLISEPSSKSFFFDQTGRFSGQRRRSYRSINMPLRFGTQYY